MGGAVGIAIPVTRVGSLSRVGYEVRRAFWLAVSAQGWSSRICKVNSGRWSIGLDVLDPSTPSDFHSCQTQYLAPLPPKTEVVLTLRVTHAARSPSVRFQTAAGLRYSVRSIVRCTRTEHEYGGLLVAIKHCDSVTPSRGADSRASIRVNEQGPFVVNHFRGPTNC